MIWVSSDTYSAALSRRHEPADPGRDEDLRLGRGKRRTAENGAATADCRSPGGKPGGHDASGELRRTLALLRIACPPRSRGARYWHVLGRAANGRRGFRALTSRDDPLCRAVSEMTAHADVRMGVDGPT